MNLNQGDLYNAREITTFWIYSVNITYSGVTPREGAPGQNRSWSLTYTLALSRGPFGSPNLSGPGGQRPARPNGCYAPDYHQSNYHPIRLSSIKLLPHQTIIHRTITPSKYHAIGLSPHRIIIHRTITPPDYIRSDYHPIGLWPHQTMTPSDYHLELSRHRTITLLDYHHIGLSSIGLSPIGLSRHRAITPLDYHFIRLSTHQTIRTIRRSPALFISILILYKPAALLFLSGWLASISLSMRLSHCVKIRFTRESISLITRTQLNGQAYSSSSWLDMWHQLTRM